MVRKCKVCKKEFTQTNSIMNVCSQVCYNEKKKQKEARKKTLPPLKVLVEPIPAWTIIRKRYQENLKETKGFLCCESCGSRKEGLGWEVHHIIFRSQLRKHPDVHNVRNLINLCEKCHQKAHHNRPYRVSLIQSRKLWEVYSIAERYKPEGS